MKNWFRSRTKHIIYWGILLIYLLSANTVYTRFFIRDGKPIATPVGLPADTGGITYNLVELRPVLYNGQALYELKGFAFLTANPTQINKITIILTSGAETRAFSTNSVPFPDMIQAYAGYTAGMDEAEFSMLLSKDVLIPGVYQIGILLENTEGPERTYVLTGNSIKQTPNTVSYVSGS